MSVLLANRYFHLLFEMLNLNAPEVSAPVWKLLNLIPTNTQMRDALRAVQHSESPDWEALLDSNSLYKLLYSLQIIHGFIMGEPEGAEAAAAGAGGEGGVSAVASMDAKEKEHWRLRFLEKGGYLHLYNILMGFEHKHENAANTAQCLASLLKIIKVFLQAALLADARDNDSLRFLLLQKKPPSATHNFLLRRNSGSSYTSSHTGAEHASFGGGASGSVYTITHHKDSTTGAAAAAKPSSDSDPPSFGGANTPNFAASPYSSKPATPPLAGGGTAGAGATGGTGGGLSQLVQQVGKVDEVQQLVEQLAKWDSTSLILKSVDFAALVRKLFGFVAECGGGQEGGADSVVVVDDVEYVLNALELLLPLILYNPGLLVQVYDFKGAESTEAIVVRMLTRFPTEKVRRKLETMVRIIAANISDDLIPAEDASPGHC